MPCVSAVSRWPRMPHLGSIGIAVYPDSGNDPQKLTKNADMAMYRAKEDGTNDYRFYSSEIRSQSIGRLRMESSLRQALELNQFALFYQPKIEAATGQLNGVEALLRWNHPDLGELPPTNFIPLAEEIGLITTIGRWFCGPHALRMWLGSEKACPRFQWQSTCRQDNSRMIACYAILMRCSKRRGWRPTFFSLR
jgi:predicted signal transduction protein with EAL and GGDEF domain